MVNYTKLKTRFRWIITWWFIRILKRTTPKERKKLEILEEPVEVMTFEKDSPLFAQVTPVRTMILNESKIENLPSHAKELLLRHEKSHQERNSVFRGLLYGFALWCAVGLFTFLYGVIGLATGVTVSTAGYPIGIGIAMITVFILTVRIDETLADYHSLCYLGEETFIEGYEAIDSQSSGGLLTNLLGKVMYSTPRQTIAIRHVVTRFESTIN